jgi:hypothetical protein
MASYPDTFLASYSDFPSYIQVLIYDIETELDLIWKGWRSKQRFDSVEYDLKARIKWLLKRHDLLTQRTGPSPTPKNWDVIIVQDSKDRNQCYAHPVIPQASSGGVTREPRPVIQIETALESIPSPSKEISLPALALRLKAPLELIESLFENRPDLCFTDEDAEAYIENMILKIRG